MLTSFKDKDEVLLPGKDQMQQGGTFLGGARFTADLPTWRRAARLQRLASGKRAVDPWPTDRGRQRSAGGHHHEGQGDDVFFCCDGVKRVSMLHKMPAPSDIVNDEENEGGVEG